MMTHISIGTRGSKLALTQTEFVSDYLRKRGYDVERKIITTTGDRLANVPIEKIPERGIFVSAIENALLSGEIDLAVHSLKDLPGIDTDKLVIAAIPLREDPRDVLIGRTAPTLESLPPGAIIATSSLRRTAELLRMRPDIKIATIRGNVDTRIRKLDDGEYDAICLAAAGVHRLAMHSRITQYFPPEDLVPAPGQGALAIQTRYNNNKIIDILAEIHDEKTANATKIERLVLAAIGGGCSTPVGVYAETSDDGYIIHAARYSTTPKCLARLTTKITNKPIPEIAEEIVGMLHIGCCD